ncbi:hypothetical protein VCX44_14600 [Aeromonas caviae]|uniref:MarR family transcriptional regulator n=1 Tax=Aeromonas caviae TaxID=648 RepID=A0ABU5W846_AERCA|nr:hypothetical protein [Aeromonas caviae]MEA9437004.1 hypothetical protein [Aeromonas caviae]
MSNQQHDHLRAAETGFRDASLALTALTTLTESAGSAAAIAQRTSMDVFLLGLSANLGMIQRQLVSALGHLGESGPDGDTPEQTTIERQRGRRLTELLDQLAEALERAVLCPVERAQYSALLDALRVEAGICQEVLA